MVKRRRCAHLNKWMEFPLPSNVMLYTFYSELFYFTHAQAKLPMRSLQQETSLYCSKIFGCDLESRELQMPKQQNSGSYFSRLKLGTHPHEARGGKYIMMRTAISPRTHAQTSKKKKPVCKENVCHRHHTNTHSSSHSS